MPEIRAAIKVNSEQLRFNWQLGCDLVIKKAEEKWGSGVVEQVSLDLKAEFPNVTGFSTTNLWYMKKWYKFYTDRMPSEKLQQHVGEMPFPEAFGYIPWGQHIVIITKCESIDEALFYIRKTIENGYSRSALLNVIGADYYHTSGAAITNYSERLPLPQAQLAQEITKGNYDLEFITSFTAAQYHTDLSSRYDVYRHRRSRLGDEKASESIDYILQIRLLH